jgi:glycosyltransferase involved in cell wall biosynthesis
VSVALCTYNGSAFIDEQLRSILGQSLRPDQLVVADDGSSDGTLDRVRAVLAEFREQNPDATLDFVELTGTRPLGLVGNFTRAIQATTGDYIALCDQDDVWDPDRLATLLPLFDGRPELALVHSDADLIDEATLPLGLTLFQALGVTEHELAAIEAGRGFEAMLRRNLVTGATTVLRRTVAETALPVPDGWIHDEWLAIIAAALWRTDVIRRPLIGYRQHGGNEIGASKLTMGRRIARLRQPRAERNNTLFRRARSLVDRLEELGPAVPRDRLDLARLKLDHERRRVGLPAARWRRIGGVIGGWSSRRYARFGLGARDALRDLVQPSG